MQIKFRKEVQLLTHLKLHVALVLNGGTLKMREREISKYKEAKLLLNFNSSEKKKDQGQVFRLECITRETGLADGERRSEKTSRRLESVQVNCRREGIELSVAMPSRASMSKSEKEKRDEIERMREREKNTFKYSSSGSQQSV